MGSLRDLFNVPKYAMEGVIDSPKGNFSLPKAGLDFRVEGGLNEADVVIRKLMLAENEVSGALSVSLNEKKPFVKADLVSTFFNLNDLFSDKKQAFIIPYLISSANALSFVPAEELNLSFLNIFNGNISLKVGDLMLPNNIELSNINLSAKLQNGLLKVNPLNFDFGGGKIIGDAEIAANNNSLILNVKSENMKLQGINKIFADKNSLLNIAEGGDITLDLSLKSFGNTYRKLSENMSGQVVAILGSTSFRNANLS